MNRRFKIELENFREQLFGEEIVKEYFKLLEEVKEDPYLSELRSKIDKKQREIAANIKNAELKKQLNEERNELKATYNSDPRVVNLSFLEDEVYNLLKQISDVLEQ
ncbi:MAG: hypothetical protein GX350_02690 [Erysipelotrichaceae bacterium]|nr:hypothetical protein [Erysipelotrichaceae bacterium]